MDRRLRGHGQASGTIGTATPFRGTREDLIPYIEAARSACLACDAFPLPMEGPPSRDQSGGEASLALLDNADVFIGIYGHRYGWRLEGAEITKGYVSKFGSGITPNSRAVLIDDLLRARLGLTTATIDAASTPPTVPPPDKPAHSE